MKAFPFSRKQFAVVNNLASEIQVSNDGMDLRDYFAAKAMAQMNWVNIELSAQEAYRVADAMMKAREL